MIKKIQDFLEDILPKEEIYLNEPMKKHTSFKIGGKADCFVKVSKIEILKKIIKTANQNHIPVTIIGNGTNLLVTDKGIRGITIKLNFCDIEKKEEPENIVYTVGSGTSLIALAMEAQKDSATGLEFACGIPRNSWWSHQNEFWMLWRRNTKCSSKYYLH